jgi:hypothetical protein
MKMKWTGTIALIAGLLLTAFVVINGLNGTDTLALSELEETHCVSQTEEVTEGRYAVTDDGRVCFEKQVDAIRYATSGRVDLPDDATRAEIHAALEQQ